MKLNTRIAFGTFGARELARSKCRNTDAERTISTGSLPLGNPARIRGRIRGSKSKTMWLIFVVVVKLSEDREMFWSRASRPQKLEWFG